MMKPLKKIKIAMIEQNLTGGEIARRIGVDRSYIWHVARSDFKTEWVRKAICNALNLPLSIWDEIDRDKNAA
ncbi:MAG: helix-turn-helix transcriptional regulator [Deltaproteobacteria bacterium]|nr:helix-turn-helix transcriptional regulator [Deltaproteobacteria bacterium]